VVWEMEEQNCRIIAAAENLSKRFGGGMSSVALVWLLKKACAPIVGLSDEKRMEEMLVAFEVEKKLGDWEMRELEEAYRPVRIQAI
jgi:aryl-alcohol dehydrogenase-like predicted oxidoreductase